MDYTGNFGGNETGWYGAVVVTTSLYASDKKKKKNLWNCTSQRVNLTVCKFKEITQDIEAIQGGMQTVSHESHSVTNA